MLMVSIKTQSISFFLLHCSSFALVFFSLELIQEDNLMPNLYDTNVMHIFELNFMTVAKKTRKMRERYYVWEKCLVF